MRISSNAYDPDYVPGLGGAGVIIRVDGVEVRKVVTADDDRGEAFVLRRHHDGSIVTDGVHAIVDRIVGRVEIILSDLARRLIEAHRHQRRVIQ